MVRPRGVVGLEEWRQLRRCCRWFVVVALVLACFRCLPADCLQPNDDNSERSALWSITDSRQSDDGGSSLSIVIITDSRNSDNDDERRSPLFELPIVVTDEVIADDNARRGCDKGPEEKKEEEEEKQEEAVVLCNVKCFRADPVCGEDAITYWCGAAEAKCAGVEVAYKGYCDSRSGGAGKDGTRAAQSLFLVHLLWLVLAGFLVIADLL